MKICVAMLGLLLVAGVSAPAQTAADGEFKLALPGHKGQIAWKAAGFQIVETSAKPEGNEIGIRGRNASGGLSFLGFLFVVPGSEPLTSAKCRDGAIEPEKSENSNLKVTRMSEVSRPDRIPVSMVDYNVPGQGGDPAYSVRGFVGAGNLCGDLEVYSSESIRSDDPSLLKIFQSFQLDEGYQPQFRDTFFFAQVLYSRQQYAAAAPYFEQALAQVPEVKGFDSKTWRRVATDQAGMSYGMSGDLKKARAILENAIAKDPDYPLYYYNLACADAGEKNLSDARKHLEQAFARKANAVAGEKLPDPTQDDSFTPYKDDKEFWSFLEGLRAKL